MGSSPPGSALFGRACSRHGRAIPSCSAMSTLPLHNQPDEDLAEAVRDPATRPERQTAAFDQLLKRHSKLLDWLANSRVYDRGQMLANLKCASVEHMVADVLWQAINGFQRGQGASFKTYMHTVMQNLVITSGRQARKLVTVGADEDGETALDVPSKNGIRPGSTAHLVLLEARELGGKCMRALAERERLIFFWGALAEFSNSQLEDLCPDLTPENIRKIKSRATSAFLQEWVRLGGEKLAELSRGVVAAMSEPIDPDRIRDPKAREAYTAWMTSNLAGAAGKLGLPVEETRKLLLAAAHDLYRTSQLRTRGAILANVLQIGEGTPGEDPLLAHARHTLDLVRAAFGLAPVESAFHTLGSFLQSRLKTSSDYDAAHRALGLSAGDLRRVLADDLAPKGDLFKRMSRFLKVPVARLRALSRRPVESARLSTRGSPQLDTNQIRERVLARFQCRRRTRS